jgi:pSer/pThr/pTyr-binding forkhead associated (FHA) protein
MSKLVLFLADGTTLDVLLDRERMTIGRRGDNDICLPNLAVSGEHAVVVTILADSFLEDLGSTNGTLVNGKAIAKHFLRDRDEIDIGRHKLVYCTDDNAVLETKISRVKARKAEHDFGGRVEVAKPVVKGRSVKPAPLPTLEVGAVDEAGKAHAADQVIAEIEQTAPTGRPVLRPPPGVASVKMLDGISAGAFVPLTKMEMTIGRPGVQVGAIVRSGTSYVLKRVEGERPPVVNGKAMAADSTELRHGDMIELAGKKLEFVGPDGAVGVAELAKAFSGGKADEA